MELASTDVDAIYQRLLEVVRSAQRSNLEHAWQLGRILDEALRDHDDRYGRGIARELVRRLGDTGFEIKLSTLYGYRQIFRTYDEQDLPRLVERGINQTHLQTLVALPSDLRDQLQEQLTDEQSPVPSTREFKRMADDLRIERTREASLQAAQRSAQARADGDSLTLVARQPGPTASTSGAAPGDTREAVIAAPPLARTGDVEKTRQMARGAKEFSAPPLKVLKAADNAAIKMMAQTGDLVVLLDEATRVGFDSDRAMQNFLDAARSLQASLRSYEQVLPELLQRLDGAIRSQQIAG